jgi:hypothetical protein
VISARAEDRVDSNGMVINAPHTGAVVRIEDYHWPDYFGASRPTVDM